MFNSSAIYTNIVRNNDVNIKSSALLIYPIDNILDSLSKVVPKRQTVRWDGSGRYKIPIEC